MHLLKVGCVNARSLVPSIHDVKQIISQNDFDIFLICETWLKNSINNSVINISNYRLYRADRNCNGKGVCVYVRNKLRSEIIVNRQEYTWEQLWVKVIIKKKSFAIGIIYKPHEQNTNSFLDEFEDNLGSIYPTVDEVICMGDFNLNLLDFENVNVKKFTSILESFELCQVIDEPTRITATCETLLDYVIIPEGSIYEKGVMQQVFSDHSMVFCKFKISKVKTEPKIITYRNYKNFDDHNFQRDLFNTSFFKIYDQETADAKVSYLVNCLNDLLDKHAPFVTSRVTKPKAPWLTFPLKKMMEERDKAQRKYKKSGLDAHLQAYKNLRNFTSQSVKREQRAYFIHQFNNGNSKDMWRTLKVNKFLPDKSYNIPDNLSNPNELNKFFVESIPQTEPSEEIKNFYKFNELNNFDYKFSETNDLSVYEAICSVKTNATGCDGLNIKFIKLCSPHIVPYITHIVNFCIVEGVIPVAWKTAVVKVLPKKQDPTEFKDLRPISILPVLSKIFEKIIETQIKNYLLSHSLLPSIQSGFRKGFSCTTALLHITDDIFKATDMGYSTLLVMLDFSRAFDTINHDLMVCILKYMGFSNYACSLIEAYLKSRQQQVCINGISSEYLTLRSGVPQGSILGPLLFSVYSSQLSNKIQDCNLHLYADDTQLYYSFKHTEVENACVIINRDLKAFIDCATEHCLLINPTKSKVMIFGNKQQRQNLLNSINITVGIETLEVVSEAKNLGVILDSDLRFEKHMNKLLQRAYCNIKMVYGNRHLFPLHVKKHLCETLVLSLFNYADALYGPNLTLRYKNKVQKVQNSCLRLIFGIRKRQRISHKLEEVKWLNMENRRKHHFVTLCHKIIHDKKPSYLHRKITYRSDVHNVNIRNKGLLTVPYFTTELFRRSFSYQICFLYNTIPAEFKMLNIPKFSRALKKHLFDNQT